MTKNPISLDLHRGMAAQKATELRRPLTDVAADQDALRGRQRALEAQLVAALAASWVEAAEKARYLLRLFAITPLARNPRRRKLIASVLNDFRRLTAADPAKANGRRSTNRFTIRSFEGDLVVANREQRDNREKRKPKAEKPKSTATISPFSRPQTTGGPKRTTRKKER
jgi:hypothetical protein